jgi:Holliday junction resolvase RusA-like endonuclease
MSAPSILRFTVPGEPVPKGRPRFRIVQPRGGKAFVQEYTPAETRAYEDKVRLVTKVAINQSGWAPEDDDRFTVLVRIFRSHWDKGGDADNVLKGLLDGMNKLAFRDDRYVRSVACALQRPDKQNPRVEVEVRRVPKEVWRAPP